LRFIALPVDEISVTDMEPFDKPYEDRGLHSAGQDSAIQLSEPHTFATQPSIIPYDSGAFLPHSQEPLLPLGSDVDNFDNDSAYDSSSLLGDDTQTLASFITDYRYENGRRYEILGSVFRVYRS
jgi:hypothetical protein